MKTQIADLKTEAYTLIGTLKHKDLLPFIKEAFKGKSWPYYFYNGMMVLFALVLFTLMLKDSIAARRLTFGPEFSYFGFGVASSFLLIPLHEYLHALAYKAFGAKQTSFDMNLKKFYFMAMADKFVVNAKQFTIVILAPFLTISAITLLLAAFLSGPWAYLAVGVFFTHALFCSGDFGLLCYLETHKPHQLFTYDDKALGETYFYIKK